VVILFIFAILLCTAAAFGGAYWNLMKAENPETDQKQKIKHVISAVVMIVGLLVVASPLILIIFMNDL